MRQKSQTRETGAAKAIKDIRRATRKQYSAEEKIRIVLDGLRGGETIAELCRREGKENAARRKRGLTSRRSRYTDILVDADRGDRATRRFSVSASDVELRWGHSRRTAARWDSLSAGEMPAIAERRRKRSGLLRAKALSHLLASFHG
jgi:transposase-like protein